MLFRCAARYWTLDKGYSKGPAGTGRFDRRQDVPLACGQVLPSTTTRFGIAYAVGSLTPFLAYTSKVLIRMPSPNATLEVAAAHVCITNVQLLPGEPYDLAKSVGLNLLLPGAPSGDEGPDPDAIARLRTLGYIGH